MAAFGEKRSTLCNFGGGMYVLSRHTAHGPKYYPLFLKSFPLPTSRKQAAAEKLERPFQDASQLTEISDKLRWYRNRKALRQRDVAEYLGISRSTYIHYEEAGKDYYPIEHMEKLAQLYEIPVAELLDDYNLFLYCGQGRQLREKRLAQNLSPSAYAQQLGVPLWNLKRWEDDQVQITKSTWEQYFK